MSKTYRSIPYKKQSKGQQTKTTKRNKMTLNQALQEQENEMDTIWASEHEHYLETLGIDMSGENDE